MKYKCIICLAAGASQLPLILAAKRRGYNVIAIDRDPDATGFLVADTKIIESTYDTENVLAALQSIEKRHHFCGVVARTSGPALNTAAAIAEEFGLPGLSRNIVPLATEKSKLREFCGSHGILTPKGQKIGESKNINNKVNFPLIIKPDLPLIGKKDVRLVWKYSDLESAVQSAIQSSGNGFAEVEEYIEGIDVSCLFLARYGKGKIINCWDELIGITDNNFIKGIGVGLPSVTKASNESLKLENAIKIISKAFSEVNALVILSFRIDFSGNPYLIEMHSDLGGDLIADVLLPKALPGFNFFDMALKVAVGEVFFEQHGSIIPTCLIYDKDQFSDKLVREATIYGNDFYIQKGDLQKNLSHLKLLMNESKIFLATMPLHENWLETNTRKQKVSR